MKNLLATTAAIVAILSAIPYIVNVVRGQTKPNLVTWLTWSLLSVVQAVADLSAGAGSTALLALAVTLTNGTIFLLALSRGVRKYTYFDLVCQLLAIVAFALWRLTGNPNVAVSLSSLAIIIAALPTWRHAYIAPFAETWQSFAIGGLAGLLTISSLSHLTYAAVALPIITLINAFVMSGVILSRRSHLRPAS